MRSTSKELLHNMCGELSTHSGRVLGEGLSLDEAAALYPGTVITVPVAAVKACGHSWGCDCDTIALEAAMS